MAAEVIQKQLGFGSALTMSASTTVAYQRVGGVLSMSGPDASAETVTELTLDSTTIYMDKYKAGVDAGTLSLTIAYSSTATSTKMLGTALASTLAYHWKLYPGSTTATAEEFQAYVTGVGRAVERNAVMNRTVTLDVTGDPGYPTT